jgi:phage baseplate assembly protein W
MFSRNPKTRDLMLIKDDQAIRTSLKNLLMTSFGERLFQPTIGGSLRSLLFEPIDAITTMEIKDRILKTILDHEPRISNVTVGVSASEDQNGYGVDIEYSIVAAGKTDRISVVLERVR